MSFLRWLRLSGKVGHRDLVEWIDWRLQMSSRQVEIDRSLFQTPMPEEQLNRAQVSARFEHVCGEAVPQRVRAQAFVDACAKR